MKASVPSLILLAVVSVLVSADIDPIADAGEILGDIGKTCGTLVCSESRLLWSYECCTQNDEIGCCISINWGVIFGIVGGVAVFFLACCALCCCCCCRRERRQPPTMITVLSPQANPQNSGPPYYRMTNENETAK